MQSVLRQRLFIGGFLVGLLVGLLIGWVIWPVHYINAYPADLRHSDKVDYILLISREFQRTGDWEALQRRLSTFPKKELTDLFVEARKTYAGQPEYTDALDTTWQFINEHADLSTTTTSTTAEQPSAPQEEPSTPPKKGGGVGKWLAYIGLLVGLLVVILALVKVYQWVRMERERMPTPMTRDLETETYPPDREVAWAHEEPPVIVQEVDEEEEGEAPEEEEEGPAIAVEGASVVQVPEEPPRRAPADTRVPVERIASFPVVFMIEAQQDLEQAFDAAKTIYASLNGAFEENLGECGLSEAESYQNQVGHPTVMEVWLFDKNDPVSPVHAYIFSPWAYNQADIREKYANKGKIILAKPNARILLQTYGLELEAEIKDVAFAQFGQGDEVFKKLGVEMTVFRRKQA